MLSPVNFDTHISAEAGRGFARLYNSQRTLGSGTGTSFTGAFGISGSQNTEYYQTASATAITEAEFLGMLRLLDYDNVGNPSTRLMLHPNVLYYLWGLNNSGFPIFNVNPVSGSLVFPDGIPYAANSGLEALATDNKVVGIGDFQRYGVYYAMGLRAAMDYDIDADQYRMAWRQWTDGNPLDQNSFRWLQTA